MKIANVQEIVFIDKSNKWFHTRKFFQMVSHLHVVSIMQDDGSTSDHQNEECIPHFQEFKFSKWMTHDMTQGEVSHKLVSRSKILCVISQEALQHTSGIYKWCHSNNQVMTIKNTRFKLQPSTPNVNLCINKKHTFLWKLMTKGERLYKNMKALGGRD